MCTQIFKKKEAICQICQATVGRYHQIWHSVPSWVIGHGKYCSGQFDAGWGGCETYHDTCDGVEGYCSTWNHYWCQWDFMYFDQTYQWGSVGVFAYDACEQCQQCIIPKEGPTLAPTAVPTPFPTLAPSPFPTAWPTPSPTSPLITPSPTFMDDGHCGEMCGCTNTMGDRRLFAQGAWNGPGPTSGCTSCFFEIQVDGRSFFSNSYF